MPTTRRWFRVWFRWPDAFRSEGTLMLHATDEHAIYTRMADEGKRVTACYADYTTYPTEEMPHE